MSVIAAMLLAPFGWSFGGDGHGFIETSGEIGSVFVGHQSGSRVAVYQDITLVGQSERQLWLMKAEFTSNSRGTVAAAIYDGAAWSESERNLLAKEPEVLSVRFHAGAGDTLRVHLWVDKGALVELRSVSIEPVHAAIFEPPADFPPLLTQRPDYTTEAEWLEFKELFARNPIEGTRYLNDLEIRGSVEICYSWPKVMQFSLSSFCNIMCRFCAQTRFHEMFKNPEFVNDDVTVEKLRVMFRDIEIGYPYNVDFSGDGEPIVHPNFLELLEFARSKFPFSNLRTCSNGLALTKEMSQKLIEHQLDWLNISLNAATPESWETTTGNKHFDRVIENIKYLQQRKRELGAKKPVLGMTYVLTRYSLECLPEFVDLCAELDVDSAAVHHMTINYGEFLNDSIVLTKRRANEVLRAVREKADRLRVRITLPALFEDVNDGDEATAPPVDFDIPARRREYMQAWSEAKQRKRVEPRTRPPVDVAARPKKETFAALRCKYPWDYLLIKGDGITRICCGGVPAENGTILEDGFWKIWNGEVRQYFRRTVNTARVDENCYFCPLNATRDVDEVGTHMRSGAREERERQAIVPG